MSGDQPDMQLRFALVALLVGCGGKTVGVPAPPADETARSSEAPDPVASSAGTAQSDPGPAPIPEPTSPTCDVTLGRDVMPIFVASSCTVSACHGGIDPPNQPRIDPKDLVLTRQELLTFRLSDGSRYVDPASPGGSSIVCNLSRNHACGAHMPLGSQVSDAELAIIQDWVICGAKVGP